MTYVNRNLVRQNLRALADEAFQERVWLASSGPEISSFTEAVCQLFDDSGLDLALEEGRAFGNPIDELLQQLGSMLDQIPDQRPPVEIINDLKMVDVRKLSSQILRMLD